MTNPTIPGSDQQDLEGRSVRDVVEYSPGQVDDAWCRRILRKILQSLELQYAMQMPHRAITPDTIVFHANGEPLLITDDIDAAPAPESQQADDLTALAGVIHYAITQELTPSGPLAGRAAGCSAALVATVDACMDPDAARRPRSIDEVRGMLGIVATAPLAGAVSLPASVSALPHVASTTSDASAFEPISTPVPVESSAPDPVAPVKAQPRMRSGRWAIAAGGCAVAIALAVVSLTPLRDAGTSSHLAPVDQAATTIAARDPVRSTPANTPGELTANPASNPAASEAVGASSGGTTASGDGVDEPSEKPRVVPKPASRLNSVAPAKRPAAAERAMAPPSTASGLASYQLQIKPWGNVFVDGVDHGVSPPLRRLTLKPGPHTIRITHPHYRESILEFESAATTSNGKIIVDFNREAQ